MNLSWIKSCGYNVRFLPLVLILIYQRLISPFIPPMCRFYPSCSAYAFTAIKRYGIWKGGFLSLIRLSKCHPFHPGGYNPLN